MLPQGFFLSWDDALASTGSGSATNANSGLLFPLHFVHPPWFWYNRASLRELAVYLRLEPVH
jgi:hypothetical protein